MANTPNFDWFLPNIGGSPDVWGINLNSNLSAQDALLRRFMNCFVNNAAPAEAQQGTMWLNSTANPYPLNIYDGAQWVPMGTLDVSGHVYTSNPGLNGFFIGDYKYSAQDTDHGAWLICNGGVLDTTTYAGLFTVIGNTFGNPGPGLFNLPDLRGAVAGSVGKSGLVEINPSFPWSQPFTWTLGQYIGEEEHELVVQELASHTHDLIDLLHGDTVVSQSVGASLTGGNGIPYATGGAPAFQAAPTGGDVAHNTMQPTVFAGQYFIFSGVSS